MISILLTDLTANWLKPSMKTGGGGEAVILNWLFFKVQLFLFSKT
jgi:hypothetical protein